LQQVEPRVPISAPGFVITNSGSYYVATNIIAVSGHGISIMTNNVTVDLNGFMLQGAGASAGVAVPGVRTNIVVRNGTIRGFGNGISAPQVEGSRFEGLHISHNGGTGLRVGNYCTVYGCNVYTNAGIGVQASTGAQIADCVVALNGFGGIDVFDTANVRSCTARGNGGNGITANSGCVVTDCLTEFNAGHGITIDRGVVRNCTARGNVLNGIDAFISCQIIGNHCLQNGNGGDGAGINSSLGGHRIEGNNVVGNDRGIDCNPSTGNLIIRNSASGNGPDYDVVAGNTIGPIITSGSIATSSNPHANYTY
jgi:parallel beta-helix repeat protein